MLEKDIENIIAKNPKEFFPHLALTKIEQQKRIGDFRIDIYAEEKDNIHIIEIKRGIMGRDAIGQVAIYGGLMKSKFPGKNIKMHLVANYIDETTKLALAQYDVNCISVPVSKILQLANRTSYHFEDRTTSPAEISLSGFDELSDSTAAAWIFQGKPELYDVLNAMADPLVRNEFHWGAKEHKEKIRIGDLVFIWMSGSDAGIYAIAKVIGQPNLYRETDQEKKYYVGENSADDTKLKVKLQAHVNLCNNPIFKSELKANTDTQDLRIMRFARGTNFPVEEIEASSILRMRKQTTSRKQ